MWFRRKTKPTVRTFLEAGEWRQHVPAKDPETELEEARRVIDEQQHLIDLLLASWGQTGTGIYVPPPGLD